MSASFGIHLGNSSICLALERDGNIDVIVNDAGDRVTPAVLALNETEWEIGLAAKMSQTRNKPTITDNKRLLNEDITEAELDKIVASSDGKIISYDSIVKYELQLSTKIVTLTPDDIASKLYGKMFSIASQAARTEGELQAVVAVPLQWSESSRRRAATAAELAGFSVLQVISEPAAAALAHGLGRGGQESYALIYRLGGTSCDVSVIRAAAGLYSIEKSVHDATIGGQCLTRDLSDYIAAEFYQKWKLNPQENRRAMAKLFHHADQCKRVLSTLSSSHVFIESLYEGYDWSQNVTRARFENLITPKLPAYLNPLMKIIEDQALRSKIDKIIFCGGSMNIPKLQSAVMSLFPEAELLNGCSPDEVIARGCAKQAALLSNLPDLNITDINEEVPCIPKSIYAKYGKTEVCIFPAGSPINSVVNFAIENGVSEDDNIHISLYEGEKLDKEIGMYSFSNIPKISNINVSLNEGEILILVQH